MTGLEPERAAALNATKLWALVRDHLGRDLTGADTTVQPGAAGLVVDRTAWYLPTDDSPRALGGALAFAGAKGVTELNVLSEVAADVLARRAAPFEPHPTVWAIEGRRLVEAAAAPPAPEVVPAPVTAEFVLMLEAAGVEVVVEHGVVGGEVDGLEIARVIVDADDVASLEVGVGRHDREAFAIMHADRPPVEALVDVAATVRSHRRPGAEPHPLNRLAPSRRLRSFLLDAPGLVDADDLVPVPPAVPRDDLRDDVPAAAVGTTTDGRPLVIVAAVGVNLDLVPEAADVRSTRRPDAQLRLVVPERDLHGRILEQVQRLSDAEIVTVPDEWHLGVA